MGDSELGAVHVNGHCDYGTLEEEPKSEFAAEDFTSGINADDCYYDCDLPKEEPELATVSGDTVADGSLDVNYNCSHCGVILCTQEFKVEHETRCKAQMQQKELESHVTEVYHCVYCRCPFVNKKYKEQHQEKWCREKPVVTRNDSNPSLERHVLTHNENNVEWFTCTQCSYKTMHKRAMTVHMKIHGIILSCRCPICGKGFRRKQSLDDHLVKHHSDESDKVSKLITSKVYTCNICKQYRTTLKANYNKHVTVTHLKGVGSQKYQCPCCSYYAFRKCQLMRHSKSHLEQKCTVCKKKFTQKRELDSHISSYHADNGDLKTITSNIHRCESPTTDACDINCDYIPSKEEPESECIDIYYHPLKEESESELGGGNGDAVSVNGYYPPEEEPEAKFAATDGDGDDGDAGDDYACNMDVDDDGCCNYGPPEEKLKPEVASIGDGSGDNDGYYDCNPPKEELEPKPGLASTGDDAVADDSLDISYEGSHCG